MGVEGGDFYEDAIIREQNVVERQEERDAIDERLERNDISQETQGGVESVQADIERKEQLELLLGDFEVVAQEEGIDGFSVFKEFLLRTDSKNQNLFIDSENMMKIFDFVIKLGRFPVNEFEFQQSMLIGDFEQEELIEKFSFDLEENLDDNTLTVEAQGIVTENEIEVTENEIEVTENEIEVTEELNILTDNEIRSQGIKVLELHKFISLPGMPNDISRYQEILNGEGNISNSDREYCNKLYDSIIFELNQNRELEKSILPQAQAQGPEVYAQVRASLISLDSGFEARIMRFEMTPDFPELPPEQMIRVSGALGTRVDEVGDDSEQSGNIFTLVETDGTQIDYDVVTDERSLTVDGYSLESQIDDSADYQTPKLEYMKVEQEHLPKLQKIIAAGNALESEQLQDSNIEGIKDIIKTALGYSYYLELGLATLTSVSEIQSAISNAYTQHNEPLQEARDSYRDTLLSMRDGHFAKLEKKDRRVKEVLRFFESIGFTDIPQYITDQVIDTLNSNTVLRNSLGFNEEIDFVNGQLGFDKTAGESETLELTNMKAFAEFVNTMLGVTDKDGNPPINVEVIGTSNPLTWSDSQQGDARFMMLLNESGMLIGGAGQAIQNLEDRNKTEE